MTPKLILAASVLLFTSTFAFAQDPNVPPTTQVLTCTTAGCHTDVTEFVYLHGPVASDACTTCHVYDDIEGHTFKPKHEGAHQCEFCHIGKTATGGTNVHEPVAKGECLECHDPHGASTRNLLIAGGIAENCFSCHDDLHETLGTIEHTAFKEGDCLGCHDAHASMEDHLLIESGRDLCLQCHEDVHGHAPASPKQWRGADFTFGLADSMRAAWWDLRPDLLTPQVGEEDCSQCHTHHAADEPSLLIEPLETLCASCHEEITLASQNAWVKHPGVTEDKRCMNCHAPHDSEQAGLLRDTPLRVCASCHNAPDKPSDEPRAEWMETAAMPGSSIHAHAGEDCTQCHDVHGGKFASLLVRPYVDSFYQPYSAASYALCLGCHDRSMIESASTDSATKFRNGELNLHYSHVIAVEEKGRSCSACHTPHISDSAGLVRYQVPFGQWSVPIGFVQTETGGSCNAGCHRAGRYDRVNPVPAEELRIIALPEKSADGDAP